MSDASFLLGSRFLLSAAEASGVPRDVLARRVKAAFFELTRRDRPTTTLEIGAFEAGFSRWVRSNLDEARAIAFEANPFVHERFRDELEGAGVEYINACIGAANGPVEIHVPRDYRGRDKELVNRMASLRHNLRTQNHETVKVEGVRLDDYLADSDTNQRMVAWIDVEGALEMVLTGARETMSRLSVAYIEVESAPIWEGQWLDVDVARWFAGIGMVPLLRDAQRPEQYNLVLVSEELAADPEVAQLAGQVYAPVKGSTPSVAVEPDPLPVPVHRSRVGSLQRLVQPSLRMENDELRAQNQRLRKDSRRLRRQLSVLRDRATVDGHD